MICKWISQLFVNFYCLLKNGKHQDCDTSSFVCLAPSIMNHINLLKLTRINCLVKATWHWNDILPRQLGIWPLINLICLLVYFCLSLSLTDVCPITVSMVGSALKRGTASNALAMRLDTVGPPATTVSANLSHFKRVIACESQVFSYDFKPRHLNNPHSQSLDCEAPRFYCCFSRIVFKLSKYILSSLMTQKEVPTFPMFCKHTVEMAMLILYVPLCV